MRSYCALIAYIIFEGPAEDRNMNTLVDMISGMEVKEDDEDFMNAVDYMFVGLEKRKPDCFAVKQYKKYKLASGKTAKSILISCGARLAPIDIPQLREVMAYDELELDRIGDRKTAVFFIISDTTQTYNSCGARLAPIDIPQLREVMAYDELELDRIGDRKTAVFFIISDTTQTYNLKRRCSLSSRTLRKPIISLWLWPFRRCSICCARGPTMFMEAACPIMYGCYGTRPPTQGRFPSLKKSWLSSVPVRSA